MVQGGDEGDGSGANGGSTSQGATSNLGATTSRAGRSAMGGRSAVGGTSTGGRMGVAGATSAGGFVSVAGTSAVGGACACPAIDCAPGYKVVPNPDGCCYHCESICNNVMCPAFACGSGSHLEVPSGQCCATCIADSCELQQKSYQMFRQQLVDKYSSFPCMIDADCSLYYEKNECAIGCGFVVPTTQFANLDSNLQSYAQLNCSPSCPQQVPPCLPRPAPVCLQGRCQ